MLDIKIINLEEVHPDAKEARGMWQINLVETEQKKIMSSVVLPDTLLLQLHRQLGQVKLVSERKANGAEPKQ